MAAFEPPSTSLSDDDVRWLMVRTARSLARLWARLERFRTTPGRPPMYPLCARDVEPREPWLESVPPNTSLSGVIQAVLLAQGLLIDAAVSSKVPDRRRLCLIVQHVSCEALAWSVCTLRIAGKLGVLLAATPRAETHGTSLGREIYQLDGTFEASASRRAAATKPPPHHVR